MNAELIINTTPDGNRIALTHDRKLVELHEEAGNVEFAVGDIYLGKTRKVLPNLNAAFVNVGYEKDAFLHYLDLGPQYNSQAAWTKRVLTGKQKDASLADFRGSKDIDKNGKIRDTLNSSQNILVQVAKEPISQKGPRLTAEITLPGRYLVLVPFSNKVSLSQKITSEEERTRLKRLIQSIRPQNFGVIVRTVAESKKVAELDSDLRDLVSRWEELFEKLKTSAPPLRVLGEIDRTSVVLRDMITPDFKQIHVNDPRIADEVKEYLRNNAPEKEAIVKLHKVSDLFDTLRVHRQIKACFGKQVNLKSGAYLVVEHTEAMHVIDVNSGGRKGGAKTQEENALQTNLECADEIARILRLRDMGGIICVDFIDMQERGNQRKLFEAMKAAMETDRAKHNILPPSRFGVVEITRQRVRPVTSIKTSEKCPSCMGKGTIGAPVLIQDNIEYTINSLVDDGHKDMTVMLHPMVEAYLTKGRWNNTLKAWRKKYGIKLRFEASPTVTFLEYHVLNKNGEEISL